MKLSIVIPVYNQEKLIIKALESIPERDDIEIIVVDDASTDKTTGSVINYATKSDNNILLIQKEKNEGVGLTRNVGIDIAKGEYIMFLDSDDYIYTEEFNKIMNMLTGEDIIYYGLRNNQNRLLIPNTRNNKTLCGTVKIIKRKFIGDTRYPDMNFAEDYYFNIDLLNKSPRVKYTNIILVHYNSPRENSLFDIYGRKKK